jgi:hypothetical protein
MVMMFIFYRPSRFFGLLAAANFAGATAIGLRFLDLVYFTPHTVQTRTYLPSLILLAMLAIFGAGCTAMAILAELIRTKRRLLEETLYLLRKQAGRKS